MKMRPVPSVELPFGPFTDNALLPLTPQTSPNDSHTEIGFDHPHGQPKS